MLQAEATSEMLIYAIIGKKEKKSKSSLMPEAAKLYV